MTTVSPVSAQQQGQLEHMAASIARFQELRTDATPERKLILNGEIADLVRKQGQLLGLNDHAIRTMVIAYTQENVS